MFKTKLFLSLIIMVFLLNISFAGSDDISVIYKDGEVYLQRDLSHLVRKVIDHTNEENYEDSDYYQWEKFLNRPHPSIATLEKYFNSAANEFDVPAELLKAIGQVESNWTQIGPSIDRGWGIMHLVSNPYCNTLEEAAKLLDLPPQELKDSARENIRGSAALLSQYADDMNIDRFRLEEWFEPAMKFSGLINENLQKKQAIRYFNVIERGEASSTNWKEAIIIEPYYRNIEIDFEAIHREHKSSPDYPGAIWNSSTQSPNFSSRSGVTIDTWVNHWIGVGTYAGAISWFQHPDNNNSSAHFVIRASDGQISQCVLVQHNAWHTGAVGYPNNNRRSIGVEHEATVANPGLWNSVPMLTASTDIARYFTNIYPIPKVRALPGIRGHNEMPGTSTNCPGPLPWSTWMNMLLEGSGTIGESFVVKVKDTSTGFLNVRTGAGSSNSIITQIYPGQKYISETSNNGWYYIHLPSGAGPTHGWAYGGTTTENGYLEGSQETSLASVTASTLNVRTGPSTGHSIITTVSNGQKFAVLDYSNGWYKIQLANVSGHNYGWASGSFLNITQGGAKEPVGAELVSINAPSSLNVGETGTLSLEIKNTGTSSFSSNTLLKTSNPRNHNSPLYHSSWINQNTIMAFDTQVLPQQSHTIYFTISPASSITGTSHTQYLNFLEEGLAWFSDSGQNGPNDTTIQFSLSIQGTDDDDGDGDGPVNLQHSLHGCPDNNVTFSWTNSGSGWYIQLSRNSNFSDSYIKWVSHLTSWTGPNGFISQTDESPLVFIDGAQYYWRMYANGQWTNTLSFTLPECEGPSALAPKREFRALWIATVYNIDWPKGESKVSDKDGILSNREYFVSDWPKPGESRSSQQASLLAILDEHKELGINAVFLQVRPACDAFYQSNYEPWSRYLTGTEGQAPNPFWDPLEFAIEACHERGMELHAWINPYRARAGGTSNHHSHVINTNPEWIVTYGASNRKVLNPGLPEVRAHVTNVILDIVSRYDIDGIHFDDYFYPYPESGYTFNDSDAYNQYGGGMSLADWRRSNVNALIEMVHDAIKSAKPFVKFGISPFGIWKSGTPPGITGLSAYDAIYCDALAWLSGNYIDYIAPQLYWGYGGGQDYTKLMNWWAEQTANNNRHFYPGLAAYRVINEQLDLNTIRQQVLDNRDHPGCQGNFYFSSDSITSHWPLNNLLKNELYPHKALVPVMSWIDNIPPEKPTHLHLHNSASGNLLTWGKPGPAPDGEFPRRYVLYASDSPDIDFNDPKNIVYITPMSDEPELSFNHNTSSQYYYAITSLDRIGNESSPNFASDPDPDDINVTNIGPSSGSYYFGDSITIIWSCNAPSSDTMRMSIKRDNYPDTPGPNYYLLAENAPNTGSAIFTIPDGITPSDDWRVWVAHNNTGSHSNAPGNITINGHDISITNIGPSFGSYYFGDSITVTWSCNAPSSDTMRMSIKRDNYPDTPGPNYYLLAENAPNTGSAIFTIPDGLTPSDDWRVWVAHNNTGIHSNASGNIIINEHDDLAFISTPVTSVYQEDNYYYQAETNFDPSKKRTGFFIPETKYKTAFEKQVEGRVIDILTSKPIVKAQIMINNEMVYTDKDGYFFFDEKIREISKVYARADGYIEVGKAIYNDFFLQKENLIFEMLPVEPSKDEAEAILEKLRGKIDHRHHDTAGLMKTSEIPDFINVLMPNGSVITMDMDEYLRGVVPSEVYTSWPMETLKAQAVAARTYAGVAMRHAQEGANVCTTTCCQAWNNNHYASTDQAVYSTSKYAVFHGSSIITQALYFAHCNGFTRNSEDVWGNYFSYLRSVSCGCGNTHYFGHGVGMCQWGIKHMGDLGHSFSEMLMHYYTGTTVQYTGSDDPEPAELVFSLIEGPAFLSINSITGELTGIPKNNHVGEHFVKISATDGTTTAYQEFYLTVINIPPVFTSTPVTSGNVGSNYYYNAEVNEHGYGNITYSLISAPSWMNINSNTGEVTGMIQNEGGNITIRANDGNGATVDQTYTFTPICQSPSITTNSASYITLNSARLNGTANPQGCEGIVYFQWGTTTNYGNTTSSQNIGAGTGNIQFHQDISSLNPSNTYNYRAVIVTDGGTIYGSNVQFTTDEETADNFSKDILIVNGDKNNDYSEYFISAVESTGYEPDIWITGNSGVPTSNKLLEYKVIIWTTGEDWSSNNFSSEEESSLKAYLDAGGSLYFSSQDYLYARYGGSNSGPSSTGSFTRDYLLLNSWSQDRNYTALSGVPGDPIGSGMMISIGSNAFYAYPDYINPTDQGTVFLRTGTNNVAIRDNGTLGFRLVHTGFAFENISNANTRNFLMERIIDYLMEESSGCNAPIVNTQGSSDATSISIVLSGIADPQGCEAIVYFQYGTSTNYGNTTSQENIGSGTSNISFNHTISGLNPNTVYNFRAVAVSDGGTVYGSNMQFTTQQHIDPPTVSTLSPTDIGTDSVNLIGIGNPQGSNAIVYFQWGTGTDYGNTSPTGSLGSGNNNITFSYYIPSGLSPSTTYNYRAVIESEGGTVYGNNIQFTTSQEPSGNFTKDILIVNGDKNADYSAHFANAVQSAGYQPDIWINQSNGNPTASDLLQYKVIIWTTGDDYGSTTFTPEEEQALKTYLDNGGNLYFSSHDYIYARYGPGSTGPSSSNSFTRDYLLMHSWSQDRGYTSISGVSQDTIGDGLNINIGHNSFINYPDYINPTSEGIVFLRTGNNNIAIRCNGNLDFRLVTTGFAFENISNNTQKNILMERILAYLFGEDSDPSYDPTAITESASNITDSSAVLNGKGNPQGNSAYVYFQWGTDTSYGNTTSPEHIGSGTNTISFSQSISSLNPGTTYHYRAVISTDTGEFYGSSHTFTTSETGQFIKDVLIVNGDKDGDYTSHFIPAVQSAGYEPDIWIHQNHGTPTVEDLIEYRVVIWTTGNDWGPNTFTSGEETALRGYLDGGGNLYFSSQDYLYAEYGMNNSGPSQAGSFTRDYLLIDTWEHDKNYTSVTGNSGDPVGAGLNFAIGNPGFSNFSDYINPTGQGIVSLMTGTNNVGIRDNGNLEFRVFVTGFAFENITHPTQKNLLMQRILDYLMP